MKIPFYKKQWKLTRKDWILLSLPALIWYLAVFQFGPRFLSKQCTVDPSSCLPELVNSIDQVALRHFSDDAHEVSNLFQNSAGVISFVLPAIVQFSRVAEGVASPVTAWTRFGIDVLVGLEIALWNGAATHVVKVATQRPRPFIISQPQWPRDIGLAYQSFYSGHTSFTASMMGFQVFMLAQYGTRRRWIYIVGFFGAAISIVTGVLRVYAGHHYVSDVVAGFLAGLIVAYYVAKFHQRVQK